MLEENFDQGKQTKFRSGFRLELEIQLKDKIKCSFFVYVLLNTQLTIKLLYGRHLYVHFHLITEVLLR